MTTVTLSCVVINSNVCVGIFLVYVCEGSTKSCYHFSLFHVSHFTNMSVLDSTYVRIPKTGN